MSQYQIRLGLTAKAAEIYSPTGLPTTEAYAKVDIRRKTMQMVTANTLTVARATDDGSETIFIDSALAVMVASGF